MKHQYVKTSNHARLMAGIHAVENRGSVEKNIVLLTGEPASGKTCTIDNWGSFANAYTLEGIPTMNVTYVRAWLEDQTGIREKGKFAQEKAMIAYFKHPDTRVPIIFDEAQHGLPNKAECIEYLRRLTELSGTFLVLVCHSSERHHFGESRVAHIATRISNIIELKHANTADCAEYLRQICEVAVDDAVVEIVRAQSAGRYRLMADAVRTLEAIAGKLGKAALTGADVGKVMLCEDAMRTLKRGAK